MTHSVKQALIHYLEFLKESGYLYAEGGVAEPEATLRPPAAQAAPEARPRPGTPAPAALQAPAQPQAQLRREGRPAAPRPATSATTPAVPSTPPPAATPTPLARVNIPAGPLSLEQRQALLADGARRAEACRACPLGRQRTQAVYYDGDPMAKIVFVGEAPGFNEDQQGKPFVGPAGQLLNKMLAAIGFKRDEVFICNTLKCRPVQNGRDRQPSPEEKAACEPFLLEQLAIMKPQILVALGAHAAHTLCRSEAPIGQLRERWHSYQNIPLLVTYHPSFLLRKEGEPDCADFKRRSWDDFKMLHARYRELNPGDPKQIWTKKEKSE